MRRFGGDRVDFFRGCERHGPYSAAAAVPVELVFTDFGGSRLRVVLGCRADHPAPCEGTVRVELDGRAVTEEKAFSGVSRERVVRRRTINEPVGTLMQRSSDLV